MAWLVALKCGSPDCLIGVSGNVVHGLGGCTFYACQILSSEKDGHVHGVGGVLECFIQMCMDLKIRVEKEEACGSAKR